MLSFYHRLDLKVFKLCCRHNQPCQQYATNESGCEVSMDQLSIEVRTEYERNHKRETSKPKVMPCNWRTRGLKDLLLSKRAWIFGDGKKTSADLSLHIKRRG